MANTITIKGETVMLSVIDADYDFGGEVSLNAIKFYPGATSDILIVKAGAATGPQISHMISIAGEDRIDYFNGFRCRPYLDFSDCTLSANSVVIFLLNWHRVIPPAA